MHKRGFPCFLITWWWETGDFPICKDGGGRGAGVNPLTGSFVGVFSWASGWRFHPLTVSFEDCFIRRRFHSMHGSSRCWVQWVTVSAGDDFIRGRFRLMIVWFGFVFWRFHSSTVWSAGVFIGWRFHPLTMFIGCRFDWLAVSSSDDFVRRRFHPLTVIFANGFVRFRFLVVSFVNSRIRWLFHSLAVSFVDGFIGWRCHWLTASSADGFIRWRFHWRFHSLAFSFAVGFIRWRFHWLKVSFCFLYWRGGILPVKRRLGCSIGGTCSGWKTERRGNVWGGAYFVTLVPGY